MIEVYKILNGIYDKDVTGNLLNKAVVTGYNLRKNNQALEYVRAYKDKRKYFFSIRVSKTWNSLPDNVVNAPSMNSFKNRLDKWWQLQDLLYDYKAILQTTSRYQGPVNNEDGSNPNEEDPFEDEQPIEVERPAGWNSLGIAR